MRNRRGITLIALVITIIVLLIIAGISILMLNGEDGILNRAVQSSKRYKESADAEGNEMEEINVFMNEYNLKEWSGDVADSFEEGRGTLEDPYVILTPEQLAFFASQVNNGDTFEGKYIELRNSINLSNREWNPIGDFISETDYKEFKGIFEGNNGYIYNLKCSNKDYSVGLFGVVSGSAEIKNLTIYSGEIAAKINTAGGVVGILKEQANIINCNNRASVKTVDYGAGGIVGQVISASASVTKCSNNGKIIAGVETSSKLWGAGGIVGYLKDGTVSECINKGEIKALNQKSGGIVGYQVAGTVNSCVNEGAVLSGNVMLGSVRPQQIGGIVGRKTDGTITKCINKGAVTSMGNSAGGIVGWQSNGTIEDSENQGEITVKRQQAGGIVGMIEGGEINGCSNTGKIKSEANGVRGIAGGIAGLQSAGTIERVYNSGEVEVVNYSSGVNIVGGINGVLYSTGILKNSYNKGEILNGDAAGLIVGQYNTSSTATVTNCYYYSSSNIKGFGSKGTDNTIVSVPDDEEGVVEKIVDELLSFDDFKKWISNKIN